MSSDLNKLRVAAEPYKSFPKAVAVCVRYLFDRGATVVRIEHKVRPHSEVHLVVNGVGAQLSPEDMAGLDGLSLLLNEGMGLAFVHHARALGVSHQKNGWDFRFRNQSGRFTTMVSTEDVQIVFNSLGEGDGVNSKQDRSAMRLVCELPRLLSPREAIYTTVTDEEGKSHKLAKGLPGTTVDGFKIDWPERFVGYSPEGLVLKLGAVRVPMTTFLGRLSLATHERERLSILVHPWLRGTLELRPDSEVVDIPVPTKSAGDFDEDFYLSTHPGRLAQAMLQIMPAVVLGEMHKVIQDSMRDFVRSSGNFVLDGQGYQVSCVQAGVIPDDEDKLIWKSSVQSPWCLSLCLDASHQVFRTIGPDRDEIMQVIWWQLAMWIEGNVPDVFTGASNPQDRTTKIYLALREQNPKH